MKQSVFNSIFSRPNSAGEQEHVVFNSLTSALARLDDEGLVALKACEDNPASQGHLHTELIDAGFLVSDDFDERAWLDERFLADMNSESLLSLDLVPTMACNLRCPYCYEKHEAVRMSPEVEDAVLEFVQRRYDWRPFSTLSVMWYGGEPTLEIDLIERLGGRLRDWAREHGVEYLASMVSNATLIDDEMAKRLTAVGVFHVMPTFDGCATCHDGRRVQVNGEGSFAQTLAGAHALAGAGINVGASCNLDRNNIEDYRQLRNQFDSEPLISVTPSHLRNYHDWFKAYTDKPDAQFDPLSRREFSQTQFELYRETNPSSAALYESLRPRRMFCQGKMAGYFTIDPEGNVCRCDGDLRNPEKIMFNLLDDDYELDWPETRSFTEKNPRCAHCAIAPTCLGQCDWEWSMFDENCSPLKYVLDDYVWLLYDKLTELDNADSDDVGTGDMDGTDNITPGANAPGTSDTTIASSTLPSVCVLLPPRDIEAEYSVPFNLLTAGGLM